jgi:ABC-type multidrug transport system fused ATPase/permease subunit
MMLKVQQLELKRDSKVNAIVDREAKKSPFMKLMKYNQPKINIVLGILVSIVQGSFMPLIGAIMAKMLFVLMEVTNLDKLRSDAD